MLTAQILVDEKTNKENLIRCLDSLEIFPQWFFEIIVGDLGCNLEIINLCREHGIKIHKFSLENDFSKIRNKLIALSKNQWNIYLESWEYLIDGGDFIIERVRNGGNSVCFTVIDEDVVSQQVRLWGKPNQFINPVFERIDAVGDPSSCMILSSKNDNSKKNLTLANEWVKRSPTKPDPYYYRACAYLNLGQFDNFLHDAEVYLFMENGIDAAVSVTMIRYYIAAVYCHVKKDKDKSIEFLSNCILSRPLMSEFWCLLGDIFYILFKRFDKASSFYQNAIILGSRRLANDAYPMEVSKYKEYPEKMLNSIKKRLASQQET